MTPQPPPRVPPRRPRPSGRLAGVAGALAVGALVVGVAAVPRPPQLSADLRGDPALAERATPLLRDVGVLDRAVVAVVDGDSVTTAGWGADDDTTFEIGSVTKTMTGALYEDALTRGELTRDARLGDLLPLGSSPAADVVVDDLATHTSGLPGLPLATVPGMLVASSLNRDPYSADLPALLADARSVAVGTPGEYLYSNLGMALLGHATAAAAGREFPDLLDQRLLGPLGLDDTTLVADDRAADGSDHGWTRWGAAAEPWSIGAWAPAGGARSTLADLVAWARAWLDGTAPGAAATEPRRSAGAVQVGSAWHVVPADTPSGTAVFHNGQTGGYSSVVLLDPESDRAVVAISDTGVLLDDVAVALLAEADER